MPPQNLILFIISDKPRTVVMDASKGEPVVSLKKDDKDKTDEAKKPSAKKSTTPSKSDQGSRKRSQSREHKDARKGSGKEEPKKDVLSFEKIKVQETKF